MLNFRKDNIWIRRLIGTELVDLYVGPQKQHFRVHKKILGHRVPHFKAVKSQVFIPKHIPPVFDMLIRWIYNNSLPILTRGAQLNDNMFWNAGHLYILAEKIGLPQLQDITMDTLLSFFKANRVLPCPNFMVYIYSQTEKTSPIRKLMVRSLHWVVFSSGNPSEWPVAKLSKAQNECGDLSADFTQLLRGRVKPQNPWTLPNCEFHSHGKDKPCMSSRN